MIVKVLLSDETLPVSKTRRILTYCRLRAKQAICGWTGFRPSGERLFGKQLAVGDYQSFVHLYEEIFMGLEYYFHASVVTPLIYDAGSNIGVATLFFKLLYPEANVVCFEPSASSFRYLQHNIRSCHLDNVTAYRYALDSRSGDEIELFSAADASLMASTWRNRNAKHAVVESVETAMLSSFVDRPIELLKMDIEGNEHAVVEDLRVRDKWRYIQQTIIEYHHHISGDDDRLASFLEVLEEEGFHYQIHASFRPPFKRSQYQDIVIYAYR